MLVAAKRLQLNFSRAAERYDAHAFLQREQLQRVAQAALEHMVEQGRIIDIGCGTGMFASVVKPERPNWWVAGVDFSYGMAQKATARCASLQGDATALPFASDSAEGIVSSLCMQWVQDRAAMMAEKFSAKSDAPPTNAPSTSAMAKIAPALSGLTEPP
jgi:malonyl-CoA O-methyltransferase